MPTFKACLVKMDWTTFYVGLVTSQTLTLRDDVNCAPWQHCHLQLTPRSVTTTMAFVKGFCGVLCSEERTERSKGFNWHHYMSHRGLNNCLDIWCPPKLPFIAQSYFLLNFLVMLCFFAPLCVKFTVHCLSILTEDSSVGADVLCDTCSSSLRALFQVICCDLLSRDHMYLSCVTI